MEKLKKAFYDRDALCVARDLLGRVLVHEVAGKRLAVRIVETEAYRGVEDKAAHSYGGRRTPRVEIMYGEPGFSYIYMIYGIHCCFNIVVHQRGNPQAVLIRAGEPLEEMEQMAQNRYGQKYGQLTKSRRLGLTNGPGKLCRALALDRSLNGADLCGRELYVEEGDGNGAFQITQARRVGIDYAGEAAEYPWRFYVTQSEYVSVR